RTVSFGGEQIDASIASALDLSDEKARQVKEKIGSGTLPEEIESSIGPALRSAFGQLNSMLGSSITFCKAQTKIPELEVDRVLLCGGTAALPGLDDYLEKGLSVPVELFAPSVDGQLPGDAQTWNVVIGLAASRLDPKLSLDLLSAPAKAKREFRQRTVFLYASAAVLVLALLVKFAAGMVASSATATLADDYGNHEKQVSGWEGEFRSAKAANAKINNQIDRTLSEVRTAAFPARIHDALREITPRAIALEAVELTREEVDGQLYIAMEIRGRSDNSDRKGIEYVSELETKLLAIPGVAMVKPDVEAPEDGVRPFTITVSPDAKRPEKSNRTRTGRSRRKS
ncbi:MAG: pilus assembly protein PilM, partial [Planctomycetota bacterium]